MLGPFVPLVEATVEATLGAAYAWEQDSLGGNDNLYLYTDFSLAIPGTPVTASLTVPYAERVTGRSGRVQPMVCGNCGATLYFNPKVDHS